MWTQAKDCACVVAYPTKRCAVKGEAKFVALGACPATCGACEAYDVGTVKLADFETWRREDGYWYSEYTSLGAEGNPHLSSSWNYPCDHYCGFIHIEVQNNTLVQRNSTTGGSVCGVDGNEKVLAAYQTASDCDGNLAGPYAAAHTVFGTSTTILGNDTVIYAVKLPGLRRRLQPETSSQRCRVMASASARPRASHSVPSSLTPRPYIASISSTTKPNGSGSSTTPALCTTSAPRTDKLGSRVHARASTAKPTSGFS